MKTFVQIPRAWFGKDGVWWKLNSEQRAALVTLCSAVSFCDHEVEVKGVKIWLEKGQFVTSRRKLMELLNMSEGNIKGLVKLLKNEGVITIIPYKDNLSQHLSQYSVLTINDLRNITSQETSQKYNIYRNYSNSTNLNNPPITRAREFVKPTLEEVRAYLMEKGITAFTAEQFHAYYESCGWTVGHNKKMRSWKGAVATWVASDKKFKQERQLRHYTRLNNSARGYEGHERRQREFEEHIRYHLAHPGEDLQTELPF